MNQSTLEAPQAIPVRSPGHEVNGHEKVGVEWVCTLFVNRLVNHVLKQPLSIIIEPDKHMILARCPDLPLYGCGEDTIEAVDMLKREIESLWEDLKEEQDLDAEWSSIKRTLDDNISWP
ncbi:hypothetical protein Dthio_PD1281 [Desulfonatronospira thiodismutans ASO3-1]|uniref:Uncharacterized protein n=1 Tax=Desulfonatronospira thiodismutans ASO3-1 TaxID=555779 RepID=D6STC6_9BACT|nr:hypothetical protein [Desulfonatronospira thiodismutans]EFI33942.1 hypothetical protein Dthio_PD1281 [Desulfonatronospira thiodismutans ASO3-1]